MNSEVLAPGGSLDHALWALEGGAGAVYVGYQKFSARSHANNLTLEDISLLTPVAQAKGARVFVALNTILDSVEVADALVLAWELYHRGVSAFIVQDLGLAKVLVDHGPPVDLHASTQAAVHNPGGVAAMKALGFCRVVLARELTMAEIKAIVAADPTMEYEVFVHGALCYAVSGNCMASGMMISRSANRGDCGQVCRTNFTLDQLIPGPQRRLSPHEEGEPEGIHAPPGEETWSEGTSGAFASMNDLELGPRVRELQDIGVTSFKIEGRMKPPAYAYNTAKAYRAFLQGNDQLGWDCLDEARLRFGRLPSAGWIDGHKALAQTNPGWAGSLGMPLGDIQSTRPQTLVIGTGSRSKVLGGLAKGDGIMVLGSKPGQTFRGSLAGKPAIRPQTTDILLNEEPAFDPAGGTLWLLSRHDGKLPVKKAGRPWRHLIPMEAQLWADAGGLHLEVSTSDWGGFSQTKAFEPREATGKTSLETSIVEIFTASDSPFGPRNLTMDSKDAGASYYVSPKELKEFRRQWYAALEAHVSAYLESLKSALLQEAQGEIALISQGACVDTDGTPGLAGSPPPLRSTLSPLRGVNQKLGFVAEWVGLELEHLAKTPWGYALPLAPFTPKEEAYFQRFRDFMVRVSAMDQAPAIFPGLNNPAHITWMRRLTAEGLGTKAWFADWGFHEANPWNTANLAQTLPGLAFAIHWLEDPQCRDKSYFPPLFTSRACMLRNSFGTPGAQASTAATTGASAASGSSSTSASFASSSPGGSQSGAIQFLSRDQLKAKTQGQSIERPQGGPRCPSGCGGQFSARLTQGKREFRVEARDCINYLIMED